MQTTHRTDSAGRRVAYDTFAISITVWRSAYICATCGAPMPRQLDRPCCERSRKIFPAATPWPVMLGFQWGEDVEPIQVLVSWDVYRVTFDGSTPNTYETENPRALIYDPFAPTMQRQMFELTAREWAHAEQKMRERI